MTGRRLVMFALAAALLAGACATAPQQGLRYRINEDPLGLDPFRVGEDNSLVYIYQIFDGLVEFVPGSTDVRPAVAASWTVSPDGTTYTFRLREGVRFHNGREVTADDVVWSIRRAVDRSSKSTKAQFFAPLKGAAPFHSGTAPDLEGASAPDPRTVVLTLDRPYEAFLGVLASEAGSILPKEVYSDPAEGYLKHPVGCGPFRFESWEPYVSLTMTRFAQHWKPAPPGGGIGRITVRFIRNASTAMEEYRAGTLDFNFELPPGQRERIRAEMPDHFHTWPRLTIFYLAFNHSAPAIGSNPRLRKAIFHAIDRDYIVRVLNEGKDMPASGVMPPGMMGHDPVAKSAYDPDLAARLLAEAGYPGGSGLPELLYRTNDTEGLLRVAERVQSDLARIGVKVAIRSSDFNAFMTSLTPEQLGRPGAFQLYRFIWFPDWPDPDAFIAQQFETGAGGNYGLYSNARFDAIVRQARFETDRARRDALYREAEKVLLEDAALVPIYWYRTDALLRPGFTGVKPCPLGPFGIAWEEVEVAG